MDPLTFLTLPSTPQLPSSPHPSPDDCSPIFSQVTACPDTDANHHADIPSYLCSFPSSSSSQLTLTYKNCIAQAANATLSSYNEALTEICNVIDVCGFTRADLSTGVLGTIVVTPTGTGEQKQIEVRVSSGILVGAIAVVAVFV